MSSNYPYEQKYKRYYADPSSDAETARKPIKVIRHYRPIGFVVAISFLIFTQLRDMSVPPEFAVLITLLAVLLMVVFS